MLHSGISLISTGSTAALKLQGSAFGAVTGAYGNTYARGYVGSGHYGGGFRGGYVSGPYGSAYVGGVYRLPFW